MTLNLGPCSKVKLAMDRGMTSEGEASSALAIPHVGVNMVNYPGW